jgi:hypothetical protein
MSSKYHVNPRIRAYGKARIDVTLRATDEKEWQSMWRNPLNPFPFTWADDWAFCFEYQVDDFPAEVGFFIDILGFEVRAFSPSYAQFTDPDNIYCLSVSALPEGVDGTDPDSIRLQFKVHDIDQTVSQLEKRGIVFEQKPAPIHEGSALKMGYFRTPHGVCIDLFGEISIAGDEDDYPREDEDDEEEADRLIEEILGLSGDGEDLDGDEEQYPGEDELALDSVEEGDPLDKSIEASSDDMIYSEFREKKSLVTPVHNISQSIPARSTRSTGRNNSNGSFIWPSQNDRKINEPTYHEIADDSGSIEDI